MKNHDRLFLRDLLSAVSLNGTVMRLGTTQRQQASRLSAFFNRRQVKKKKTNTLRRRTDR